MNRGEYIDHLLTILCYDSFINHLCVSSRYWVHREIVSNSYDVLKKAIVRNTLSDVMEISKLIQRKKWKRPELRYNSDRVLEIYHEEKQLWQSFKPEDHV